MKVVTWTEIKTYAGIPETEASRATLIADAVEEVMETLLGTVFGNANYIDTVFGDDRRILELSHWPATALTKVTVLDADLEEVADITEDVELDGPNGKIELVSMDLVFSSDYRFKVEYKAGWSISTVPKGLKLWILDKVFSIYTKAASSEGGLRAVTIGNIRKEFLSASATGELEQSGFLKQYKRQSFVI